MRRAIQPASRRIAEPRQGYRYGGQAGACAPQRRRNGFAAAPWRGPVDAPDAVGRVGVRSYRTGQPSSAEATAERSSSIVTIPLEFVSAAAQFEGGATAWAMSTAATISSMETVPSSSQSPGQGTGVPVGLPVGVADALGDDVRVAVAGGGVPPVSVADGVPVGVGEAVRDDVGDPVRVAVREFVTVGDAVHVGETLGLGVEVAVGAVVAVCVGVREAVLVAERIGVRLGDCVAVPVGEFPNVGVRVTDGVDVRVPVAVNVPVVVRVAVAVGVDVTVPVRVTVGVLLGAKTMISEPTGSQVGSPSSSSQPPGMVGVATKLIVLAPGARLSNVMRKRVPDPLSGLTQANATAREPDRLFACGPHAWIIGYSIWKTLRMAGSYWKWKAPESTPLASLMSTVRVTFCPTPVRLVCGGLRLTDTAAAIAGTHENRSQTGANLEINHSRPAAPLIL